MLADRRGIGIVARRPVLGSAKKNFGTKNLVKLVRGHPVKVVTIRGKNALRYVNGPRVPVQVIGGKRVKLVRLTIEQRNLLSRYSSAYQRKVRDAIRAHPNTNFILADSQMLIISKKSRAQISVPDKPAPELVTGRGGFGHATTRKTGIGFGQR